MAKAEDKVRITHYCACSKCCGKHANGITASGHKVRVGGVAANRYPMGTVLYIVELKRYVVVTDRTHAKYSNRIDIYTPTHGADVQIDYAHVKVVSRGCWDRNKAYDAVSRGFSLRDNLARKHWYAAQEIKRQEAARQKQTKKETMPKAELKKSETWMKLQPKDFIYKVAASKDIVTIGKPRTEITKLDVPEKHPLVPITITLIIAGCYCVYGFVKINQKKW